MRFPFPFLLLPAFFLTSCANEGIVVRKNSHPLPFYHSVGVDGSYKFALRDNAGTVRSQLVTPEVFENYVEGDYFNDLQPPVARNDGSSDMKATAALLPATNAALPIAALGKPDANRRAANVPRPNHSAVLVKTAPSSISRVVMKTQATSPTGTLALKRSNAVPPRAAIAKAHPPSSVTAGSRLGKSSSKRSVTAKTQTASRRSAAAKTRTKSTVASSARKRATHQSLTARKRTTPNQVGTSTRKNSSRRSVASNLKKTSLHASKTVAVSRKSTQVGARSEQNSKQGKSTTSKASARKTTPSLNAAKSLKSKKAVKRTVLQTAKTKTADVSRLTRSRKSAQLASVSIVRVR